MTIDGMCHGSSEAEALAITGRALEHYSLCAEIAHGRGWTRVDDYRALEKNEGSNVWSRR